MSEEIKPFNITISDEEVDRYYRKIRDHRPPTTNITPDSDPNTTAYGFTTKWATDLYDLWANGYDWRSEEKTIKQWPHFTTEIEGLTIHFIHQKSKSPKAIPLLMCHGWPGSFYEFSQVINPLSDSDAELSFHCVVPSLPGFGWSSGPPKGWTLQQTARVFHTLMQRLGYKQFVFQGGDWAHWIGRELGANYSDSCKVIHFNFAPAPLPEGVELTDREREVAGRVDDWLENHMGYAIMMRTRPHTIGWMCQDNPVAIMVWLGEKVRSLFSMSCCLEAVHIMDIVPPPPPAQISLRTPYLPYSPAALLPALRPQPKARFARGEPPPPPPIQDVPG
jgi:pimeloyl-ACP methyl ester carboxylesterase